MVIACVRASLLLRIRLAISRLVAARSHPARTHAVRGILGHKPDTARLFEQALVMGKVGLINGEAERQTMPGEDASAFDVQCSRRQLRRVGRSRVDGLVS